MPSICDRCHKPGYCCSGINLNGGNYGKDTATAEEMRKKIISNPQLNVNGDLESWDLEPLYQRRDGVWIFWCKSLDIHGRCTVYNHRPTACRDYYPQSDDLCWHHDPLSVHLRQTFKTKGEIIEFGNKQALDSVEDKD